jgi:hypothetical protein
MLSPSRQLTEQRQVHQLPGLEKLIPERNKGLCVMAFDPGETTGFAVMHGHKLLVAAQLNTKTFPEAIEVISREYRKRERWDHIRTVCEDYRVYAWKSDDHKWAGLHTPQIIGCIKTICHTQLMEQPIMRMAADAKTFVTDEKLVAWGLYQKGQRHARDAIRHAVYSLIYDK